MDHDESNNDREKIAWLLGVSNGLAKRCDALEVQIVQHESRLRHLERLVGAHVQEIQKLKALNAGTMP